MTLKFSQFCLTKLLFSFAFRLLLPPLSIIGSFDVVFPRVLPSNRKNFKTTIFCLDANLFLLDFVLFSKWNYFSFIDIGSSLRARSVECCVINSNSSPSNDNKNEFPSLTLLRNVLCNSSFFFLLRERVEEINIHSSRIHDASINYDSRRNQAHADILCLWTQVKVIKIKFLERKSFMWAFVAGF